MEAQPKEIQNYIAADGRSPFEEWFLALRDFKAQNKIEARLQRVRLGNLGDYRSVSSGVFELRVDSGPGYRV